YECLIEFYRADTNHSTVESIVVNLTLGEEVVAVPLYEQIAEHLKQKYGIPDQQLGNYIWRVKDQNLQIHLRWLNSKREISLCFGRL
ncbi:MAG: hypothetical protein NZ108_05565, partial [Bacteroidia bacterium]|nr:hypothetical protein [Bacteroidia bacterium]